MDAPQTSLQAPFFLAGGQQPNSITSDRGLTTQQVNSVASTLSTGSSDLVTGLNAIAAAINAKAAL